MKIAVAVDFSIESHFAIRWALALREQARRRDLPVELLAITVPSDVQRFKYRSLAGYPTDTTKSPGIRHWISHHVREFLEAVDDDVDDVEIVLREGEAADVIATYCAEADIDWLVTGMNSADAFSRFVLGSTVHELRDIVPCNLVVVHPEHHELDGNFDIATGIDFLPGSDAALFAAAELADLTDAHLHLVHALQDAPTGSTRAGSLSSLDATDIAYLTNDARQSLEALMEEVERVRPDLEYSTLVHSGPARRVFMEFIDEHAIDAVFLGRTQHSTLEKWLAQSLSQFLLKHMPTTLVLVPKHE